MYLDSAIIFLLRILHRTISFVFLGGGHSRLEMVGLTFGTIVVLVVSTEKGLDRQ